VLFEVRVRRGKLLACSLDLRSDLAQRPVARQLLASLLAYMETPQFAPPANSMRARSGNFFTRAKLITCLATPFQ
jgi:hypothetical protein